MSVAVVGTAPAPRKGLECLLAGLWFGAFYLAAVSILFILVCSAIASIKAVDAGALAYMLGRALASVLLWIALGVLAFGIAGASLGWRLFRDPLRDSDAFLNGAGIGIAASAILLAFRLVAAGLAGPEIRFGRGIVLSHVWTLGLAGAIGCFGAWTLLRLRRSAGK